MFLSFSTRVMLSLPPISSLYFDTLSMVTWYIIQLQIYLSSKRCFSIWVAHSLKVQTVQGFVRPCPFARTGRLLAQQPSTRFRVPCSGLRVTLFHCFLQEFLHSFTITFQFILITIFHKIFLKTFFWFFSTQVILIIKISFFHLQNQLEMIKTNKTNHL